VPGYEILDVLGKGGMGVVYRARQQSLGRLVALKFLPPECARDPFWLERFWREARTASALNHPHVCTIYDTGEAAGRPFLSMELIEGRTLETLVGTGLPVPQLAALVAQAARALHAAHAAGIVHRDVKPANLMVRDDGIVKVLDFGLARRLSTAAGAAPPGRGTEPGTLVGTLLYLSPEQARAEPAGPASDVFALGLVLYELATGRHPFLADSDVSVLHAIVNQAPVPPSRLNPAVPAALDDLVLGMLARDATLRPSAAAVADALDELAEGRAAPAPAPAPARRTTVGRARERAALRAAFESAAAGRGLLVGVAGEAGLGKTTLVEDFLAGLAADGLPHAAGRGRCSERLAGAEAYLPFIEALEELLRGGSAAGPALQRLAPAWYAQLAPPAGPAPAEAAPSPERLRRQLDAFLADASRTRTVVLFLDDVHWADSSTVDLVAYLAERCPGRRLLVVAAYRPSELAVDRHPFGPLCLELQGRGLGREVPLELLTQADVEHYLALRFPGHDFPPALAGLLHRRTEGNPLFLADVLQDLADRGLVALTAGRWALARPLADLHGEVPPSVRGLIQRKLDRLDEADRRLLTAAAVQGQEFDAAVLARALGRDEAEVEDRLAQLDRVHALVHRPREQALPGRPPTLRYGFVHVLYQNALYAVLQPTRRAALSAAVAEALAACRGPHDPATLTPLAFLWEAARDVPRAADAFLRAAEHAAGVAAGREAELLARRGLALLARLPAGPARAEQELRLLLALGVSLVATRGFAAPDVEETYERAWGLCRDRESLPDLFPVLYGLWNVYLVRGELPRCKDLASQLFARAQAQADPVFLLLANNVLQQPLFHLGDFAAARRHQEQGLALYDRDRDRHLTATYGEDPGVGCLAYGAATLWHLGYSDQARQTARAARDLAEDLARPFNVAQALYYGALTHQCCREPDRVEELAGQLLTLCAEHEFALLLAGARVLHGWAVAEQGRPADGLAEMRRGLADWQATGALSHRPFHLALLAEVLNREGKTEEALAALAEALQLVEATGERFCEAELHRLRGELLAGRSPAEAEAAFRQALAVAGRQQARSSRLRAALGLARLFAGQGRTSEARPLLAEACAEFTEGLTTPDLREAEALLQGCGDGNVSPAG
jgi:predicted ATPase